MEPLSIFEIFKIGIGPSSSHTLGPWKAAARFIRELHGKRFDQIEVKLFGSLSKTGRGHATDVAVQLGLMGYSPETMDIDQIDPIIDQVRLTKKINVADRKIVFDPTQHIEFCSETLSHHPNTLIIRALLLGDLVQEDLYMSIGGGFIQKLGEPIEAVKKVNLPFPINKGIDLDQHCRSQGVSVSDIVYQNELHFNSEPAIQLKLDDIFNTMLNSVYKGCTTSGVLPGGLQVKRRASKINEQLLNKHTAQDIDDWLEAVKSASRDFRTVNQWISCFALAVNEENASMGRVVTSPTNGAAGVIPAVLLYHLCFHESQGREDIRKFLFASGEIGCIFKKNATISAAVGGCQAEIGVSSAMAAAGLTEVLGGSVKQVLMAAEIAMEHHLGLTCDPVGGLVQIPCIERNTMGAMKAITASNLALSGNPDEAVIMFDTVVKTMWDTAQEMNEKYKETSEGGLAYNLPVLPNC